MVPCMTADNPDPAAPQPLRLQALTDAAFAPYGRVLHWPAPGAADGAEPINGGTALRAELVGDARLTGAAGRAVLSISRALARVLPMLLTELERHQHGSQAFVPLGGARRLAVVVARPGAAPGAADLAAFISDGTQGVLLAPGTWHHALLALDAGDFLVIERRGEAPDCDLHPLPRPVMLAGAG
jgi:ureidoglycolate lyase